MSKLYIVGTPIGNLEDLTLRALRVLQEVDYVLCEDTRVTKKLLNHYNIRTATLSYHQHSGHLKVEKIISLLREEKTLALVTDAGTPGISDPGGHLVSAVRRELGNLIKIESVPGVSALTTAASLVGEGFDRFLFLGFLPHKKGRQTMLKEIWATKLPVVIYESKHRILKLLIELSEGSERGSQVLEVCVARELTKLHESVYFGSPESVRNCLESEINNLKGEFVVLVRKI